MSSTDALRDVGSPFLGRGTRVTVVSRELERQGGVESVVGALLLSIRRTPYSSTSAGFISVHESYVPGDEPIVVPPLHGIGINN